MTKEEIKRRLEENGWSQSPGLLAETIYGYVLDERERCAKIVEESECYEHQRQRCEDCTMGLVRSILAGR